MQLELRQANNICVANYSVHAASLIGLLFKSEDGGELFTTRRYIPEEMTLHTQGVSTSYPLKAPVVSLNELHL